MEDGHKARMRRKFDALAERVEPDWSLWLYVEAAYLWELVDLSLNREPDFIKNGFDAEEHPRHSRQSDLCRHMARGSVILQRPSGYGFIGEPDSIHQKITVDSFRRWAAVQGWTVPPELRICQLPVEPAPDADQVVPPQPVQRHPAQEAAILEELRRLGLDPLALPAVPKGKASPEKAAVRATLRSWSDAVFTKAWKRLTAAGGIGYR